MLFRSAAAVTLSAMLSFKGTRSILFTVRNKADQLNTGSPTTASEKRKRSSRASWPNGGLCKDNEAEGGIVPTPAHFHLASSAHKEGAASKFFSLF